MNNDWTDIIGKKMKDHQMDGPDNLWQDIEHQLNAAQDMPAAQTPRHKTIRLRLLSAVAACIALLTGTAILFDYIGNNNDANNIIHDAVSQARPKTADNHIISDNKPTSGNSETESITRQQTAIYTNADNAIIYTNETATAEPVHVTDSIREQAALEAEKPDEECSTPQQRPRPSTAYNDRHYNANIITAKKNNNRKSRLLSISAYTTNLPKVQLPTNEGDMTSSSSAEYADIQVYNIANTSILHTDLAEAKINKTFINKHDPDKMDMDHKTPLNIGLKARFSITDRVFAETGLVYSYLKSEGSSHIKNYRQKLHYIGIPIGIGYDLWQTKRLTVYAVGGGMAQKLLDGQAETLFLDNPKEVNSSIEEKRLQWSVNASAGIEYTVYEILRIYAEPGISYFFDNGSNVDNYYKDKPMMFNIQFGIRLGM